MIRNICKDELFLARKAAPALPEDLPIAQDLLETLIAPQRRLRRHGSEHDRRR